MGGNSNPLTDAVDAVGGLVQGATDAVGEAGQGVIDMTTDLASSDLGKAALIGGTAYLGADAAGLLGEAGGATEAAGAAGAAGATEAATTGATTAPVLQGSVVETPLGSLTADNVTAAAAGGEAVSGIDLGGPGSSPANMGPAEAAAGGAAVENAATGAGAAKAAEGGAEAAAGAEAAKEVTKTAAPGLLDSITGKDLLTAGAALAGTAALVKATQQPEIVQQTTQSGQTTTPGIDFTANEKRASADEISNVMAFQTQASKRTRMTGASVLSNSGVASTGTKKLLGA